MIAAFVAAATCGVLCPANAIHIDSEGLCKEFSRHDQNVPPHTAQDIFEKIDEGACAPLPVQPYGDTPEGSTTVMGFKKCIKIPIPEGGLMPQIPGTLCLFIYGVVYPG